MTNKLLEGLKDEENITLTENLAKTYKSTKSDVLDFFSMGGALRTRDESQINSLFSKAFAEDKLLALKALFYLRDIRGGQGERRTFKSILNFLGDNHPHYIIKNIEHIPFYGRWDDTYALKGTRSEQVMADFLFDQFDLDMLILKKDKGAVSLLGKWLPSENTSSKKTKKLARFLRHKWGLSSKEYRKALSALRKRIDIVERYMCSNEWKAIDYAKVPSRAAFIYRRAFKLHDPEGYEDFLNAVEKGEKEIKAATLYPYDIVRAIATKQKYDRTLDLQWKNQTDWLDGRQENSIVVCDTSGSMGTFGSHGYRSPEPIYISVGLAMYFAERNTGPFHNHFITFSAQPHLQEIKGMNIYEKLMNLSRAHWDMNTNIQAVFDLILKTAIANKVSQDEMVKKIYIISDMEFDAAQGYGSYSYRSYRGQKTNFEMIRKKYEMAGYELPLLVFWNVDSRQNNVPVTANEDGVLLVSGSSPSIFKTLMSGKSYTPYDMMLEVLNSARYDRIQI